MVFEHKNTQSQGGGGNNLEPVIYIVDGIPSRPVDWLWRGMIPKGKLTILCGDPGLGKSFVTLDMCARASLGTPFPGDEDGPATFPNGR